MEEYERLEEARKAKREEERKADAAKAAENGLSDDEDKYEVEPNAPGYGYDERTRTSTRNLRIREDVAKYLLNDGNSAHYDPKSRSMRELPDGRKVVDDPKLQNGNQEFVRGNNDDADNFSNLQKFAWQSERMGGDVHLQANPTAGEIRHKKLLQETEKKREAVRSSVLDKYGGEEHLAAPAKELLRSTEQFVEYTKTGDIIKGTPTPKTTSRYAEDGTSIHVSVLTIVYINNHSSVYGSYYRDGRWGYACCHQFHKNSYCTGTAGIEADEAAARLARGEVDNVPMAPPPTKDRAKSTATVDAGQLRDAIKDGTKRKRPEDGRFQLGQRELSAAESAMISEEEWEDYQRNKVARTDDPLHSMQNLEGGV
jgi:pre-mRNA-processing factor SLU7